MEGTETGLAPSLVLGAGEVARGLICHIRAERNLPHRTFSKFLQPRGELFGVTQHSEATAWVLSYTVYHTVLYPTQDTVFYTHYLFKSLWPPYNALS